MKKYILFPLLIFVTLTCSAQFQNWDFELGGNNGLYDTLYNWSTTNPLTSVIGSPSFMLNSSAYSGNYAASLNTVALGFAGLPYSGVIVNGRCDFNTLGYYSMIVKAGEPISMRPDFINGYFYYVNPSIDTALGIVLLKSWNYTLNKIDTIGYGEYYFIPNTGFSSFSIPINYYSANNPDSIVVAFFSTLPWNSVHSGKLKIDALSIGVTSGSSDTETYDDDSNEQLINLYPNPFSTSTTIELPSEPYTLTIYDIVGNKVREEQVLGTTIIERGTLTKGIYIIEVRSESNTYGGKLVVE